MTSKSEAIILYATYPDRKGDRFDQTYYVDHHLPIVMEAWAKYGLLSAAAFFSTDNGAGTVAICECKFRDQKAVDHCFSAPETTKVMEDIKQFTDLAPSRCVATPL